MFLLLFIIIFLHGCYSRCSVAPFTCIPYSDDGIRATDVHRLRPRDISLVMAIGDSITAGLGINSKLLPFGLPLKEYRSLVFDIGGSPGAHTIPNFISAYNPNLKGQSTDISPLKSNHSALNYGVSGSFIADLHSRIRELIHSLNSEYKNQSKGWKMLGILLGANDICHSCYESHHSADEYENHLRNALTYLKQHAPKTFVNIYTLFPVSQVYATSKSLYCRSIQTNIHECDCSRTSEGRIYMDILIQHYNLRARKVAAEFSSFKDFKVVVQPGMEEFSLAQYKRMYLANFDCFHPNACAHKMMATLFWNNMFQTKTQKENISFTGIDMYCPKRNDYFRMRPFIIKSSVRIKHPNYNHALEYPICLVSIMSIKELPVVLAHFKRMFQSKSDIYQMFGELAATFLESKSALLIQTKHKYDIYTFESCAILKINETNLKITTNSDSFVFTFNDESLIEQWMECIRAVSEKIPTNPLLMRTNSFAASTLSLDSDSSDNDQNYSPAFHEPQFPMNSLVKSQSTTDVSRIQTQIPTKDEKPKFASGFMKSLIGLSRPKTKTETATATATVIEKPMLPKLNLDKNYNSIDKSNDIVQESEIDAVTKEYAELISTMFDKKWTLQEVQEVKKSL